MAGKKLVRRLSLSALALAALGAAPLGLAPPPGAPLGAAAPAAAKLEAATSKDLGGADRFLSYVATDKPIYRANEKVYVRAVLLNAATHQPLDDKQQTMALVTILGPKGETVASGGAQSENSVVGFSWTVPEGAAGGEYTFKIKYPYQGYAPSERKFDVRIYRAPRLRNQVTFAREGYGVGDKVTATVHSERAEGGFPAGAKVTVTARVDDQQVYTGPASVDAKGDCTATFTLPKAMERGEGTLAFAIEDGGVVETAAKTIPILLQTLDLNIYPEGGDAIANVGNRFYIEARTPAKKPADLVGAIFDSKGTKVAEVKTEHEGRGRFYVRLGQGETYTLKLSEPAGITKTWKLPAAKDSGVAVQSMDDVVGAKQSVKVRLSSPDSNGPFKVTLMRREVEVADPVTVKMRGGGFDRTEIAELKPKDDADGVLTLTVWNDAGVPLAERLVYRQPAHQVKVSVTPGQTAYTPGGKATLNILTTDENGEPVPAMVGLTVTDDTVLEMIEKREQAPRLPAMVLLEPEVRELADAHIYLDPANPKAALATDLLLGTQGWRRFATFHVPEFMTQYGDAAKRVLAFMKPEPPVPTAAMPGGVGGGGVLRLNGVNNFAGGLAEGAAEKHGAVEAPAAAMPPMPENEKLEAKQDKAKDLEDADQLMGEARPMVAGARMMLPRRGLGGGGGGNSFVVVREYAHALRPNWSPTERSDFTETVYWNAGIKTDASGKGTASFALADSVTTLRVLADAFGKSGTMGTSSSSVAAVQPFFIEPKIPLEVTAGDVIELPVSAVNNTPEAFKDLNLTLAAGGDLKIEAPKLQTEIPAGGRLRQVFTVIVGNKVGESDLTIKATAGAFSDNVTRKLRIKPMGFPTQVAFGGVVNSATPAKKQIVVPASVVPHSMTTFATVYPSPMANLTDAVAALLREPCGCFEQTSSSNYPVAMAQTYFMTHQGVDPALAARGQDLLAKGYQKLVAFECKDKGYEWFGGTAPGHEALTAYGLMEFHDMQAAGLAVVDDKMIERTRTWLVSREDGKGGFQRNQRALDSFGGAPDLTTNAYIVWALQRAGQGGLDREVAAVRDASKTSGDSYVLALAANIAEGAKDTEQAKFFMNALAKKQNKEGGVDGAETSITRSGGQALEIETTALATLAWMQDKDFAGNSQNGMRYLAESCKGGRFGSTQSTILALKAIVAGDQALAHPKAAGSVTLFIDDKPAGEPQNFSADSKGPITFTDFGATLTPGSHNVEVRMTDGSEMPFSLGVNFNSTTPASDKLCKLDLVTTLKDAQLAEGGITELHAAVANTSAKDAATPVAIIGIPGGLEVRHDQLKELVKAGKIDAYEVRGREVVLYWRQIKAGAKNEVSISVAAAVPGTYVAPASRVYEYYTDEAKEWVDGGKVRITAK